MRARLQGRFALTSEVTASRIDDEDEDDDENDEEGLPLPGVMLKMGGVIDSGVAPWHNG